MTRAPTETDLLWAFIRAVPFQLPGVRVERRPILRGAIIGRDRARVSCGIAGQADAFAIAPGGRHVEIETKSARGRLRAAQQRWRAWCRENLVPHLVLRPLPDEAPDVVIARWIAELRAALESMP